MPLRIPLSEWRGQAPYVAEQTNTVSPPARFHARALDVESPNSRTRGEIGDNAGVVDCRESGAEPNAHKTSRVWPLVRPERWLLGLFLMSLVLMNPWVRGDGVGYYAFARAVLIQRNLDFTADYNAANASFRDERLDEA